MSTTVWRVAAAQFATGTDVAENLVTALRMIDEAAAHEPNVIVLPEFCNHLSVYDSAEHCWAVAIALADDGDNAGERGQWAREIGARAARYSAWIQVNCTVRRDYPRVTVTNLLFAPDGLLMAANDKTVLMGAEGTYLSPATAVSTVVQVAPEVLVGTYACMDGVIPEVPRSVAVRGAQLMLNSLNSFALDEAELHIPVRAAENRAWVVACCKVGSLLPADKVAAFSSAMGVPGEMLCGAGESQVVSPNGSVVARGPRLGEAVVVADIDVSLAGMARPDGTDVMSSRRPSVYAALAEMTPAQDDHFRAETIRVCVATTVDDVVALGAEHDLIVLPELAASPAQIDEVVAALGGTACIVVTSMRDGDAHVGIAISSTGPVMQQRQIHAVARLDWATSRGDQVNTVDLPWGRLAIVVGDDLVYPEVARLAALVSADVIAVPFSQQEPWETEFGLIERAAENRMCVVAANARSGGDSLIVTLPPDFTLWAPSRERVFDGRINRPDVLRSTAPRFSGVVHPARSLNRQISRNTDLVNGRPWHLCDVLVSEQSPDAR